MFDIAILGAGPAGCAAALTLRRFVPALSVAIVARPDGDAVPAVGETLSPGVRPLLHYLGIAPAFERRGHLACGGTASAWGSAEVQERSYLFSGRGRGWHLDRAAFDAWLRDEAAAAGATLIAARLHGAARADDVWRIELDDGTALRAGAIVDATGRAAWLLKRQEAAIRRDDALVAEARWFAHDDDEAVSAGALVEAMPDGWWYSASLPGRRGVAMFMTDVDLRLNGCWDERLARAAATRRRLCRWRATGATAIRAAHSQCATTVTGDGWVAAGDAAAGFDPIAAMGIGFSLRSGVEAARVAAAMLDDELQFAVAYDRSMQRIYADYRARLGAVYAGERRWPGEPFWARRQVA